MKSLLVTFLVNFLFSSAGFAFADILVTLPNGQIRGHELVTDENTTFYGFQGIPYAASPTGSLRFQAPIPAENWTGVWDATADGADCINRTPQNNNTKSEDCLFINVYTPTLNASSDELLPVMFWIYGGSFNSGTSTYSMYGPDYLIQEGIVFVSFNYRLGPFGFLSTEDTVIPGNAGLKDQNLALKWTYENIHLFGGDPEKITIFGESAGSTSVTYHLLSEKSAGLFRAAIGESGTAICHRSLNLNPKNYALKLLYKLAELNDFDVDNSTLTSTTLLEILSNQTAESISQADAKITDKLVTIPCIEVSHDGAFITESSFQRLNAGNFTQVPTIMGINSEEYLVFMGSIASLNKTAISYDQNIENLIPVNLNLDNTTNTTKVAEAIKEIYLDSNQTFADNLGAAVKYGTDNMLARSVIKHAKLQSKYTNLFFYQFSYHGVLGMMQNNTVEGALGTVGHAEEMPYLFKMVHNSGVNTTDLSKFSTQDVLVQKRFIKLWTNFAKYLNPTPEVSDLLQNITWPALKHRGFQYLDIGEDLELVKGYPRENSFHPWNTIYHKYGERPFYTY